jgi:hypothetical protein
VERFVEWSKCLRITLFFLFHTLWKTVLKCGKRHFFCEKLWKIDENPLENGDFRPPVDIEKMGQKTGFSTALWKKIGRKNRGQRDLLLMFLMMSSTSCFRFASRFIPASMLLMAYTMVE